MAAYPGQGGGSSSKKDLPIDLKDLFFSPLLANPIFDLFIRIPVVVFLVACFTYGAWGADGKGCGTTPITWNPVTWYHRVGCFVRGAGQTMPDGFFDVPDIGEEASQDDPELVEGGE
jgi:hypothetical protein